MQLILPQGKANSPEVSPILYFTNMNVFLNGQQVTITDACNLKELLDENSLTNKKGVAVALNEHVIPRDHWENTTLNASDSIIVIQATQGG